MQTSRSGRSLPRIGIFTFLAAMLVAIVLVAAPAIGTLILSFRKYELAQGLSSPFVGLSNYQTLFHAYGYGLSLVRTLQFSTLLALTLFVAGALAGYALRAIPARWLRHALCTLLLLPLLTPGELWAQAFFSVFPSQAVQSLALLSFWCGIKYVGLAALLTTAALGQGNRLAAVPLLSAGAVSLGLFALLGLPDYAFLRLMSPLSAMRDNLDLYVYRQSIQQSRFGVASAVTVVAVALRAVLLAAVAFPVAALVKRLFRGNAAGVETTPRDRFFSLLIVATLALLAAVALAMASRGLPIKPLAKNLAAYPIYVALAIVGAAVNAALCFCLARPVVTAQQPLVRRGAAAILLALTALGAAPVFIGGYLQIHALGMVNTFFPVLLSGLGSPMGVWPMVFAANALGVHTDEQWFKRMWRPALALLAVSAALRMNDTLPSMIYLTQVNLLHPLQVLSHMYSTQGLFGGLVPMATVGALMTLITMALPTVLLLVVRTLFTEKETMGLGLPMK